MNQTSFCKSLFSIFFALNDFLEPKEEGDGFVGLVVSQPATTKKKKRKKKEKKRGED